ncbi:four-carbon acid sugar kinase family protein [Paenibacillus sp. XY044]|uniref:four-carbon acid sugar kinase family protein n=1 Tax=Paenibacillus sp. XY044 TaxID=2026089 RepID=UPI000B97EDE8|nr:four-carbon acid sugar kinase family protein [Paenibacillus sp. XY044]OZB98243.1 hydroxyacid dehydrogenase [Paenibacillus sp. XY044]
MDRLKLGDVMKAYDHGVDPSVTLRLRKAISNHPGKIIVLDDDPTGVQTVHNVTVVTGWDPEHIRRGFLTEEKLFFILTNSRSFTAEETRAVHREAVNNIIRVSRELNRPFILVSRSDSTLRGHYPLETETLRDAIESETGTKVDGEIIFPFFKEGGRYTVHNTHYVENHGFLTPSGETEFAQDKTFGYHSSDLCAWVEEKTSGHFRAQDVAAISLQELRACDAAGIAGKLMSVCGFNKVIVNALDYGDAEVFCLALYEAMEKGKRFLFRTAASFVRVFGGVQERPLLKAKELFQPQELNEPQSEAAVAGGLIVAGSHTGLTTGQLQQLERRRDAAVVELNQHLAAEPEEVWRREIVRASEKTVERLKAGYTVVLRTKRERFDIGNGSKEDELRIAVRISAALTEIVSQLTVRPRYIVAKGGITSSDIGTKALGVTVAVVAGQIKPGIPVWICGEESKYPHLPYIIFPGNVGEERTLLDMVEELTV